MDQHTQHHAEASSAGFASVSVIVPVYNRAQLIVPCLEHLAAAAGPLLGRGIQVEVVVADDASTDQTRARVEALASSFAPLPVRLVSLKTRQGPGRARNAALEASEAELVVFVDSDIIVVPDFLNAHLAAYRDTAPTYTVGPVIGAPDLDTALGFPAPTAWDLSNASLHTANASVPRAQLETVGVFDSGFEGYGWEDLDLGRRLKKAGLRRVVVKEAVGSPRPSSGRAYGWWWTGSRTHLARTPLSSTQMET